MKRVGVFFSFDVDPIGTSAEPTYPRFLVNTHFKNPAVFALVLFAVLLAGCTKEVPRPSAILITLDTTRADVVGAFGGRKGVTPYLDMFAAESVCFSNARTVTPLTLPSHCSMMTGLYPPRHTVRVNSVQPLPQGARTLAEHAQDAGLQTAAIVASIALDESFGVGQGFATYLQPTPPVVQDERSYNELPATEITERALRWLGERDESEPFFLWVNYFDPHIPLAAPNEFGPGRTEYEAEVTYMDQQVGRLLAELRSDGVLDEALVIVVADHGESNDEHGEATHGAFCYDATLRVPLMVRHPGGFGAGTRVDATVSVADVFPTVMDHWRLDAELELDGRSLLGKSTLPERGVYFESHYGYLLYGWSPMAGWAQNGLKLVQSAEPQLFAVNADPHELENIYTGGQQVAELERALSEQLARPALADEGRRIDPAMLERLQALGYTAGSEGQFAGLDPFAESTRLAPHARALELTQFSHAQSLAASGQLEAAIAMFMPLVGENPHNTSALYELGQLYARDKSGTHDERAIQLLTRALEQGRDWYGPHVYLGQVHWRRKELLLAEQHLRAALESNPKLFQAMGLLGVVCAQTGRADEGRQLQAAAQALKDESQRRR